MDTSINLNKKFDIEDKTICLYSGNRVTNFVEHRTEVKTGV